MRQTLDIFSVAFPKLKAQFKSFVSVVTEVM